MKIHESEDLPFIRKFDSPLAHRTANLLIQATPLLSKLCLRCIWLRAMTRCREVFLLYKDLPCERRSDEWESSESGAYFIGTPFGYTFTSDKAGWALPKKLGGKQKGE